MREIEPKLERWYNITLHLEDSTLRDRRLTATFQNEPITEVLDVLALSLNLNYQLTNREITLSEKH
ncbi:MAG: DUF4974 domain-containing protein [Balneolaceae bacterium]|nr:DUF4974 domain-containing protein [Balneolaceae bacterium]